MPFPQMAQERKVLVLFWVHFENTLNMGQHSTFGGCTNGNLKGFGGFNTQQSKARTLVKMH